MGSSPDWGEDRVLLVQLQTRCENEIRKARKATKSSYTRAQVIDILELVRDPTRKQEA